MDMLNLTLPLKQDAGSQAKLKQLLAGFAEQGQPLIDGQAAASQIIHSARLLVIDDKYLQVLTVFDGDFFDYTEFFRQQLGPVFETIFKLGVIKGAASWEEVNTPNGWYEFSRAHNVKALGNATTSNPEQGYLYTAFGETTVRDLRRALDREGGQPAPAPGPQPGQQPGPQPGQQSGPQPDSGGPPPFVDSLPFGGLLRLAHQVITRCGRAIAPPGR